MISVYCPTYNRAEILADRALPSVLRQTYTDFEFIIMGDCCTDNTEDLVYRFQDPRVRFYNMDSREGRTPEEYETWTDAEKATYWWLMGPTWAANAALDLCRGEWIARIDDDDVWTDTHLEDLYQFAVDGYYDFVSSGYYRETQEGREYVGKEDYAGGTQTWLYKAALNLRYDPESWRRPRDRVNDLDFARRVYEGGWRMGFLDKATCYIYPRPGDEQVGSKAYLQDPAKVLRWIKKAGD